MHNRVGRASDGRQGAPVGPLFHMHVAVCSWRRWPYNRDQWNV